MSLHHQHLNLSKPLECVFESFHLSQVFDLHIVGVLRYDLFDLVYECACNELFLGLDLTLDSCVLGGVVKVVLSVFAQLQEGSVLGSQLDLAEASLGHCGLLFILVSSVLVRHLALFNFHFFIRLQDFLGSYSILHKPLL